MERVPPPVGNLPEPEVAALLSPFMYPTPHAIANNMLFLYIKYHMVLGIKRYIQYTQVRPAPARPHPMSLEAQACTGGWPGAAPLCAVRKAGHGVLQQSLQGIVPPALFVGTPRLCWSWCGSAVRLVLELVQHCLRARGHVFGASAP